MFQCPSERTLSQNKKENTNKNLRISKKAFGLNSEPRIKDGFVLQRIDIYIQRRRDS